LALNGRNPRWADWPAEKLLDLRMCDLGLEVAGSCIEAGVERLYAELEDRDLRVKPHVWLSNEWFCPDGVPGIAAPFYLAHPRLKRLERRHMLEVEGGTHREMRKLLRHEAGHAIVHAFNLQRRKRWREVFGSPGLPYPEYYRPNPASRRYVLNLDLWYAQAHPHEDFAETFAVWLAPRSNWRQRYAGWPALRKLEYVDELMASLAGEQPCVMTRRRVDPISALRQTLRDYYRDKGDRYAPGHPDDYDDDLKRLFTDVVNGRSGRPAASFLRSHRSEIRRMVARWTGEYEFTLDVVLGEMIGRCKELRLRAVGDEQRMKLDFTILLTSHTMHYLYRKREWHAL
jgi:hypothetical protein